MNSAREDGLSSIGEAGILKEIENNLVTNLDSTFNSIYVGSLTSNSCRDFYFYGNDTISYGSLLTKIMIAYPQYHYNYGLKKDDKWSGYFDFLYPSTL